MEYLEKEVYFHQYCQKCKYEKNKESDEPCDECLAIAVNENSHKPLYFESKN